MRHRHGVSYLTTFTRVPSPQSLQLFVHTSSAPLFSWTTKIRIWCSTLLLGDQLGSNMPVRTVCSAFLYTEQSRQVNLDLPHTVILRRRGEWRYLSNYVDSCNNVSLPLNALQQQLVTSFYTSILSHEMLPTSAGNWKQVRKLGRKRVCACLESETTRSMCKTKAKASRIYSCGGCMLVAVTGLPHLLSRQTAETHLLRDWPSIMYKSCDCTGRIVGPRRTIVRNCEEREGEGEIRKADSLGEELKCSSGMQTGNCRALSPDETTPAKNNAQSRFPVISVHGTFPTRSSS